MPYRYVIQRQDYSDFASGKVFINQPGRPAFPVRLALEIFERCLVICKESGLHGPIRLYDPCCGGAYHLAALAFFFWGELAEMIASDIDAQALEIAGRNLGLLTLEGMDRRIEEIERLQRQYGKSSHAEALASAGVLREQLVGLVGDHAIRTDLFQADVFDGEAVRSAFGARKADLVVTDVPYGWKSAWQGAAGSREDPIAAMLETLSGVLAEHGVVVVASAKGEKIAHPGYAPVGKLKLGLRQVAFFKKE